MAIKPLGKQAFASGDGLLRVHAVEAGIAPGALVALDDESGVTFVKAIAVCLEDAVFVYDKVKRKCLERISGSEPDIFRRPNLDIRLEKLRVLAANGAIDAVGGDH